MQWALEPEDICLVAGTALAAIGIRPNNDIDIVVRPEIASRLNIKVSPYILSNEIDIYVAWAASIGFSDQDLIDNPNYHYRIGLYKVARPEIVFAYKNSRGHDHDLRDIQIMEDWLSHRSDWDWSLCRDPLPRDQRPVGLLPSKAQHFKRLHSRIYRKARRLMRFAKSRLVGRKSPWSILKQNQRITNLVHNGVVCAAPINRLVHQQYRHGQFNRYDLIVRYLAAEEYFGDNDFGWALYEKMQKICGFRDNSVATYQKLLNSVEQNGLDPDTSIEIDEYGNLVDGAHRLSLVLYF